MAPTDKDPESPATTSCAYDAMSPRWALIDNLLNGTEAMRAAGEKYLPKHQEETQDGYNSRLASAVLFNVTAQTLDTLVGKPFRDGLRGQDVPESIDGDIWDDIDLQGNDAEVFVKRWFREGLAKAFAHVLVDMPRAQPRPDGQPRTLADDRAENRRPYWVFYKPEQVIYALVEVENGVEVLKHLRIVEEVTRQNGFAEVTTVRIRVLEPGTVTLYVPSQQKRKGKTVWVIEDTWNTGLDVIPFVTFYAHRDEIFTGKPPLEDLAHLNVAHWQSDADQRHILSVARFPILACSGASKDDSDPVVVGPNKILYNEDPQGKFYYVEHTGAAIEAGYTDMERLEERMSSYGAEFLRERSGGTTATEVAVDTADSTSLLADYADRMEDAVAQALGFTALWMGDKTRNGGTVLLNKNYADSAADPSGLEALHKARERREISRKAYLKGLIARGVLPSDFDEVEDAALLGDEVDDLLLGTGLDLNPGAPAAKLPAPAPSKTAPKPTPAAKKTAARKPAGKAA